MTIARVHFVAFGLLAFAATSVRSNGQGADAAYEYSNGLGDLYAEQWRTAEDGLPSNEVHAVAQTNDGFLWIGTTRGLARFDGTHFRRVTTTDGPRDHDDCSSLLCDRRGRLWAAIAGEIRRQDHGQWRVFSLPAASKGGAVTSLGESADGAVWCATDVGLFRIGDDDRGGAVEPPSRDARDGSAWWVVSDENRDLYVACDTALARRDGTGWKPLVSSGEIDGSLRGLARAQSRGVWVADASHVWRVADDRAQDRRSPPPSHRGGRLALCEDRRGRLWMGHATGGLAALFVGSTKYGQIATPAPSSQVDVVFEDRDRVVHVGTIDSGLWSLAPFRFHAAGEINPCVDLKERAFEPSHMRWVDCLTTCRDGLLVGTYAGFVHVGNVKDVQDVARNAFCNFAFDPAFSDGQIRSLLAVADRTTWIGTVDHGLWREPAHDPEKPPPDAELVWKVDRVGREVVALLEDGESILVASERGLSRCSRDDVQPVALDGVADRRRMRDLIRADGVVWAAGEGGLFRQDGTRFRHVSLREGADDVSSRGVRSFRVLSSDLAVATWLDGSGASVVQLGAEPLATARFSQAPATDLLVDDDGRVWINSDSGLDRFEVSELRACLRGASAPTSVRATRHDGLPSGAMLGDAATRAARLPDGRLWFATDRGLFWFTPTEAAERSAPLPLAVEDVVVDGELQSVEADGRPIEIPAGTNRVQLRVTIPTTRFADSVGFQYRRLGELRWTDVGRQRSLEFPAPPPGVHAFELAARSGDGVLTEPPLRVELRVAAFFWQTLWFKTAAALAVAAGIVLTMRSRHRTALARERERSAAAEQLAAETSRSDALLSATEELVCFADPDQRVVSVNAAGCRVLGDVDESRVRSLRLVDLFAAGARATIEGHALPTARARELWSGETELAAADGAPIRALCTLRVHRHADGSPAHFSLVARDLTERVETERTRRRLEAELRQAQKLEAIGTLAGGIAHDFNNLLTAILGHAELAREALPRDPRSVLEGLDEILEASGRARDLVRQILRFSRRNEHQRVITTLFAPVQEACRLLHSTLPASIQLVVDLQAQEETVIADATEVHQVVVNLGTNAAQALTSGRGRIDVRLEAVDATPELVASVAGLRPGRHVRLTVADDGVGMPPQVLERAFEPFFTTKPMGEGTGLGLALVHAIVASHDGAISVKSEMGKGSRFDVYFPVVDAALEIAQPVESETPLGQGEELLVVDDERAVLDLSKRMLERLGYRVVALQSPSAALARFESSGGRFAALVTDLAMSDLNGLQLARRLRERVPDLPVVLVTGYLAGLETSELASYGIDEVVAKPFTMRAIAEALHRAVRRRAVTRST